MGATLESAVHDAEHAAAAPRMVRLRARQRGHRGGALRHGHAPRRLTERPATGHSATLMPDERFGAFRIFLTTLSAASKVSDSVQFSP